MWSIYIAALAGGGLGLLIWWLAMFLLRRANWNSMGQRLSEIRGKDKRSEELKYHNEAIYRDFEYFFKVTLALLGGIAYVVTRQDGNNMNMVKVLLPIAGGLQLVTGVVFALFIFFHQKSKIERWEDRFSWWWPFLWQECWMVTAMFSVSAGISFGAVPLLLGRL